MFIHFGIISYYIVVHSFQNYDITSTDNAEQHEKSFNESYDSVILDELIKKFEDDSDCHEDAMSHNEEKVLKPDTESGKEGPSSDEVSEDTFADNVASEEGLSPEVDRASSDSSHQEKAPHVDQKESHVSDSEKVEISELDLGLNGTDEKSNKQGVETLINETEAQKENTESTATNDMSVVKTQQDQTCHDEESSGQVCHSDKTSTFDVSFNSTMDLNASERKEEECADTEKITDVRVETNVSDGCERIEPAENTAGLSDVMAEKKLQDEVLADVQDTAEENDQSPSKDRDHTNDLIIGLGKGHSSSECSSKDGVVLEGTCSSGIDVPIAGVTNDLTGEEGKKIENVELQQGQSSEKSEDPVVVNANNSQTHLLDDNQLSGQSSGIASSDLSFEVPGVSNQLSKENDPFNDSIDLEHNQESVGQAVENHDKLPESENQGKTETNDASRKDSLRNEDEIQNTLENEKSHEGEKTRECGRTLDTLNPSHILAKDVVDGASSDLRGLCDTAEKLVENHEEIGDKSLNYLDSLCDTAEKSVENKEQSCQNNIHTVDNVKELVDERSESEGQNSGKVNNDEGPTSIGQNSELSSYQKPPQESLGPAEEQAQSGGQVENQKSLGDGDSSKVDEYNSKPPNSEKGILDVASFETKVNVDSPVVLLARNPLTKEEAKFVQIGQIQECSVVLDKMKPELIKAYTVGRIKISSNVSVSSF